MAKPAEKHTKTISKSEAAQASGDSLAQVYERLSN
jgi:hypothetical protein